MLKFSTNNLHMQQFLACLIFASLIVLWRTTTITTHYICWKCYEKRAFFGLVVTYLKNEWCRTANRSIISQNVKLLSYLQNIFNRQKQFSSTLKTSKSIIVALKQILYVYSFKNLIEIDANKQCIKNAALICILYQVD